MSELLEHQGLFLKPKEFQKLIHLQYGEQLDYLNKEIARVWDIHNTFLREEFTNVQKELHSEREKLALAEIRIKELRHELKMQLGYEGCRVRDISVEALEKIAPDKMSDEICIETCKPKDRDQLIVTIVSDTRIARDALTKIKAGE